MTNIYYDEIQIKVLDGPIIRSKIRYETKFKVENFSASNGGPTI